MGNKVKLSTGTVCQLCRPMQWRMKRVLEWAMAGILLVLLSPFLALLALLIKLDSPGPILFVQERLGRYGRVFRMYKFRSLRWEPACRPLLNADGSTRVFPADTRVTRLGRFLRVGFDELPQLCNVLRNEMALIGPRPDQPFHRDLYTGDEQRKLAVLPGITGLPQCLGRNDIPWKARIQLDLHYIDHYSLWLDLRIALRTLATLFRGQGIYGKSGEDLGRSALQSQQSVSSEPGSNVVLFHKAE